MPISHCSSTHNRALVVSESRTTTRSCHRYRLAECSGVDADGEPTITCGDNVLTSIAHAFCRGVGHVSCPQALAGLVCTIDERSPRLLVATIHAGISIGPSPHVTMYPTVERRVHHSIRCCSSVHDLERAIPHHRAVEARAFSAGRWAGVHRPSSGRQSHSLELRHQAYSASTRGVARDASCNAAHATTRLSVEREQRELHIPCIVTARARCGWWQLQTCPCEHASLASVRSRSSRRVRALLQSQHQEAPQI